MDRPKLKVAEVLRRYGEAYREQHAASLSPTQRRVMSAIERCRTAALGSHREHCDRWINAPTNALVTTRAEIGIAQSASAWRALSGSRIVKLNSSIPNTSTSSSPCRKRLPPSHTKTKNWGTAFCSGLPPKPYAPLPPIPNIWAPRSASSPYCTVGDKTCFFIPISIVLFLAAGSPPDGDRWVSGRSGFFLPVRVLSRLFRR